MHFSLIMYTFLSTHLYNTPIFWSNFENTWIQESQSQPQTKLSHGKEIAEEQRADGLRGCVFI